MEIKEACEELKKIAEENNVELPIRLKIGMDKYVPDSTRQGNEKRYLRCFVGKEDVGYLISIITNKKLSEAVNTKGCVIVHGCGMDMAFALQASAYSRAAIAGYSNLFDMNEYTYLGKRIRGRKYPYLNAEKKARW